MPTDDPRTLEDDTIEKIIAEQEPDLIDITSYEVIPVDAPESQPKEALFNT